MRTSNRYQARFSAALASLSVWLMLVVLSSQADGAEEAEDSVVISSVHTYLARNIETDEPAGHLLLVRANVRMSSATASTLKVAIDVPVLLAPWIEVNGKQYLQCVGEIGGGLGPFPLSSLMHPEDGALIWPIFYIPEGLLDAGSIIDLIMVIQNGSWLVSKEPVSRASIPWTRRLIDGALDAVHVDFFGDATEERTDYKKTMGATRQMQAVSLRFPDELVPAISEIYCDNERAEDNSIGDPFVARFASTVDPLSCRWEVRFTRCGVKLEMDVRKPQANDSRPK